ncbi:MAG: hypothetical protein HY293_01165 [Planctomycetes bacterium]|nr:hypothetical protein [Planctomycetota bacterium]
MALFLALVCAVAWIFVPGECVIHPAGSSEAWLKGSVFATFVHPFAFDWVYLLYLMLKLSPIALVALATVHWQRRFGKLRGVAAMYALGLSAAVALHPYRYFSDVQLIIIVSLWGIVVLVAHESKASPGSALLALMSVQLVMSEVYSGLGADRGLPFWILVTCLSIVFCYGIFHYTRMLRHSVLGRYTEIHKIGRDGIAYLRQLDAQRRRLEEPENPEK